MSVPAETMTAYSAAPDEEERKYVECKLKEIERARDFDKKARKDYALCRRYARGDSAFDNGVNLLGTYIDIMVSFLYARNPDIDAMPAERIQAGESGDEMPGGAPNPLAALAGGVPGAVPAIPGGAMASPALAAAPGAPVPPAPMLPNPTVDTRPSGDDLTTLKTYGRTMEIVLSSAWRDGRMKRIAKRWLRGALTVGIGWIKSGWQEEYATDPTIEQRKRDLQENLAKVERLQREILDAGGVYGDDQEKAKHELQEQLAALESVAEKQIARGIFYDYVPGEDIQVSLDVQNIVDCEVASWIAHRSFFPLDKAKDKFRRLTADDWKSATIYAAIEPTSHDERRETPTTDGEITDKSANRFRTAGDLGAAPKEDSEKFVCVWEVWDATKNAVCDVIEGVKRYATEPAPPNVPTTRFYPFFPLALNEVDGERHPQSLVMRSFKLQDEYNRTRDGLAKMRARIKPRVAFDARSMDQPTVDKIINGDYAEWIPIKPSTEDGLQGAIWQVPYPNFDAALFDTQGVKDELEILWGIQEALSGSSITPKTATEAEIQQAGTNARTGASRDTMEDQLTEIAQYNSEIAAQRYDLQDARDIAGPGAIWLDGLTVQDLGILLNIEIRAGSTGKPNTTREREAWAVTGPALEKSIIQIGGLLKSDPREIARCLAEVLKETLQRAGERVDADRFLPRGGMPIPMMDQAGNVVPAYPAGPGEIAGTVPGGPAAGTLPTGADPMNPQGTTVAPTTLPEPLRGG